MHMSDSREIAAPPADVWAAILDPEVLKACVPGCESMTGSAAEGFEAVVVQKVGPVKARFTGAVKITDVVGGESLTISGEGKGGPAGFAKGGAKVRMEPAGEGTLLSYEVEANVGGKLAQLGSRIIDGFAKKMADEFFTRFKDTVEGPAEPEPPPAPTEDGSGDAPVAEAKKGWFRRITG
jgi:carbon monoxide dehydrogenase subunit G